jgi:hypothetical protein
LRLMCVGLGVRGGEGHDDAGAAPRCRDVSLAR